MRAGVVHLNITKVKVDVFHHVTQVSKELAPTEVWSFAVNGTYHRGTGASAPMVVNEATMSLILPEIEHPTREDAEREGSPFYDTQALPTAWLEAQDITNAILFLVSDEARFLTGAAIPVDAGYLLK